MRIGVYVYGMASIAAGIADLVWGANEHSLTAVGRRGWWRTGLQLAAAAAQVRRAAC